MTIIIMIIKKTLGTFELLQSSTQKWGQWGKLLKHQRPLLGSDVVCLSIKCDNVLPTPSGRTPKDTHLFSDSSHWKLPVVNVFATSMIIVRWERKRLKTKTRSVNQGLLLVHCPWPKTFSGGLHFLSSITAREKRQKHTIYHITGDDDAAENWNLLAPRVPPPPSDGPWLWFMQMMWDIVHEEGSSSSW